MIEFLLAVTALFMFVCGTVAAFRAADNNRWRRTLTAYRLRLPAQLTADDVAQWLSMVAAATHARQGSLLPLPPLGLEIVARRSGIEHYVLVPRAAEARLLGTVRAGLPGARLDAAPDFLAQATIPTVAGEVAMTSRHRPLATERAEAASLALLASLQPLHADEEVRMSWAITSGGTPAPIHSASPKIEDRWWSTYLVEGEVSPDAEVVRAARTKQAHALLQVVMRVGVTAPHRLRAHALFGQTWSTVHSMNAPGVRLVRRWLPSRLVAERMAKRMLPITGYPLLLNTRELTGLIGFPLAGASLPGLALGSSRQLPPSPSTPRRGTVLAESSFPGLVQPLALRTSDRLRHIHVLGPTGVGKSTLIANMALQDIESGAGVVLVDPKGDLVADVLARIPEQRRDDVIVLDPAATDRPVGFNLLGNLGGEAARELAADHVVHIMASLWADSWGPRSNDLVRNAVLTLASTKAPDGSAFTLVEVPELLTNTAFRRYVTGQKTVPAVLRSFWHSFEQISDAERVSITAAPLNKLRALSTRASLRLLLGQSEGVDIADVFTKRRILLVNLSKGTLGAPTAHLVGAVLVASLWHATLRRAAVPPEHRRPAFVYLDEFQDVLRLPLDIADMLAQARGLGVGFTLAHQFLGQLPEAVKTAVLGTTRSSVVYQLDHDDARTMERRYAPLTADDLMGLPNYEAALRLSVQGHTQSPVTGRTLPLPPARTNAGELAKSSRERYGVPRTAVETALRDRVTPPGSAQAGGQFGRRATGGRA